MSLNEIRTIKIKQLEFLALTEEEKNFVVEVAKQVLAAENDYIACEIADKHLKAMCFKRRKSIVDIITILLKGGHIVEFGFDPKNLQYLVFSPIPNPPHKKTLVGYITKKQFNELSSKGLITERKDLHHTDSRGKKYSFYKLAEDITLRQHETLGKEFEQLKQEKAALLNSMAKLKICTECKYDSYCTESSGGFCEGYATEGCCKSDGCPCMNCVREGHWEWRGIDLSPDHSDIFLNKE